MLKKSLSIFFAIDFYNGSVNQKEIAENLILATKFSWNYFVTDEEPHLDKLKEAFNFATKKIANNSKQTMKIFEQYQQKKETVLNNTNKAKPQASSQPSTNNDEDFVTVAGEVKTMGKIFGAGFELFTVGFYQMVIKGNSDWESKLEINN